MTAPRSTPPPASSPTARQPTVRQPVNGWLHFGGAVLAMAGLVVLAVQAVAAGSVRHVVAGVVFGVSAVAMFAASALYHLARLSPHERLFQRLDHAMIYVFIAGTYTPVCLLGMRGSAMGVSLLVAAWVLAALGVLQKVRWPGASRALSTGLYLGMGWLAGLAAPTLLRVAPPGLFGWLLAGGLLYTVGATIYATQRPRGWPGVFGYHEIWHVLVLAASASHYWAVLSYLMPLR